MMKMDLRVPPGSTSVGNVKKEAGEASVVVTDAKMTYGGEEAARKLADSLGYLSDRLQDVNNVSKVFMANMSLPSIGVNTPPLGSPMIGGKTPNDSRTV